jgi:hypothetical protein
VPLWYQQTSSAAAELSSIQRVSRRFIRGSRFPKLYGDPRHNQQAADQQESEEDISRERGRRSEVNNSQSPHHHELQDDDAGERLRAPREGEMRSRDFADEFEESNNAKHSTPFGHDDGLTLKRKASVRKLLKDTSTYGSSIGKGKLGGDPFLTGPYVRGTKMNVKFDQGNDAQEESLRRKIDPSTTSVITQEHVVRLNMNGYL